MKVLITGAKGQVGHALAASARAGCEIVALDRHQLDITDPKAVRAAFDSHAPTWVFNAAAYTAVDQAESQPDLARRVNCDGAAVLARAADTTGCRMLHVSTDFVFSGEQSRPYAPDDPTGPLNAYGATKLEGESAVRDVLGKRALIVRTSWVYSSHGANFVLRMLELMKTRDSLRVVQDQIGAPTWAQSLAECIWALAADVRAHGLHHWCDSGVASWYDFAVAIQEEALSRRLLARRVPVLPIRSSDYPTAARRPSYSVLDTRATSELAGWTPPHWRHSLRKMLDELAANRRTPS